MVFSLSYWVVVFLTLMVFIVLAITISVLSLTEILVFNEEVLLALCFVCFIFFIYSISNESIANDFEAQTSKLVADLLQALDDKMHKEMELYKYSKDALQLGTQVELISALFLKDLIMLPESSYLLLTEQISYMFLHEITDKTKTIKSKEKAVQSVIIERYIFSCLFDSKHQSYISLDINMKDTIAIYNNIIVFTEVQIMD